METIQALTGAILGTSLSPELWIAAIVVIVFARSFVSFCLVFMAALACLIALKLALIPRFGYVGGALTAAALLIWSSVGWGIKTVIRR